VGREPGKGDARSLTPTSTRLADHSARGRHAHGPAREGPARQALATDARRHRQRGKMPRIVAFDVNETLLDLRALDPLFGEVFGDAALRPLWFAQMLQLSFVGTITGNYVDFTTAQHAALRMLAMRQDLALSAANAARIVVAM